MRVMALRVRACLVLKGERGGGGGNTEKEHHGRKKVGKKGVMKKKFKEIITTTQKQGDCDRSREETAMKLLFFFAFLSLPQDHSTHGPAEEKEKPFFCLCMHWKQ